MNDRMIRLAAVLSLVASLVLLPASALSQELSGPLGGGGGWATARNQPIRPGGRLTPTTGVPVPTATVSSSTVLHYASYVGNSVPVYAAAQWQNLYICPFPGTNGNCDYALTLGSNWAASTVFDVYAENNIGLTQGATNPNSLVELCTVAWSSGTARATALAYQDGLLTNATAIPTCRISNTATVAVPIGQGTYLGSFVTIGSTGTFTYTFGGANSGGGAASMGIWNYYNRVSLQLQSQDNGVKYAYTSSVLRQARGSAGNGVQQLIGVIEDGIQVTISRTAQSLAVTGAEAYAGVGVNSATQANPGCLTIGKSPAAAVQSMPLTCSWFGFPTQLGLNTFASIEAGDNVNANQFNFFSQDQIALLGRY